MTDIGETEAAPPAALPAALDAPAQR